MEEKILNYEKDGDYLGIITINRPQALNALNRQFFAEMNILLDKIASDSAIRVLVITGSGKAFVAGADIAEMSGMDEAEAYEFSALGQETFSRIERLPFAVIAAVNGFALGGGMELAMACDIRIASETARFGQPEVNLGLIPGFGGTQRLTRFVGFSTAKYLLITGDMLVAQDALMHGLVAKVFAPEVFIDEVMKIARNITSKGPLAVRRVKEVSRLGFDMKLDDGLILERREFAALFGGGSQSEEGMNAFLQKRKASW
ncbi:MAG: enoyl-CoA hydratase-related protein [Bacteroidales bacterium]|jgi:enoyl-CoA hydratase|nr:enoyl-CoA hydratase-related protein [Bacteroidales bacterium]